MARIPRAEVPEKYRIFGGHNKYATVRLLHSVRAACGIAAAFERQRHKTYQ